MKKWQGKESLELNRISFLHWNFSASGMLLSKLSKRAHNIYYFIGNGVHLFGRLILS